jgi:YcfA-like protein.
MYNQPNGIRPEEADKVLRAYGYVKDRQNGSHMHYIGVKGDTFTIVYQTPLKAYHVKNILRRIRIRKETL